MYGIDLSGRHALVMGVANHRSLSWAIADLLHQAGATLCLTYASERFKGMVEETVAGRPNMMLLECDVTKDEVGKAGLFLLSDLGSGVTGEVLMVDAGYSIVAW